jgi:hypothetical protein
MNVPKKSKTYHFHDEWEIEYFKYSGTIEELFGRRSKDSGLEN